MLKQLGILDNLPSRNATESTAPDSLETIAAVMPAAAEKENEAVLEEHATSPLPTVSVMSKEQAMQLLKPSEQAAATRKRSKSKKSKVVATAAGDGNAEAETETESEDSSLEGKFVNLVDLLLPVPIKGEFDVNKIKSSLYFFS
jgi:DNA-directed RNA polymerase